MAISMVATDAEGNEIDYGLLFERTGGAIKIDPWYLDIDNDENQAILDQFFTWEGGVTPIVSATLKDFIERHDFVFTDDIVKLYYGIIAHAAGGEPVAAMWR